MGEERIENMLRIPDKSIVCSRRVSITGDVSVSDTTLDVK